MKNLVFVIIITLFLISPCRGNLPTSSTIKMNISNTYIETSTKKFELDHFPLDCSQRQKHNTPHKHKYSRLKKCCPIGESLSMSEENHSGAMCGSANIQLKPNLVNVTLYDNCIEDMQTVFSLPVEIGNPCNTSILYQDIDDIFFIIQDGSLLVMDLYANDTFVLYNSYCVDINNSSGITFAIVCITSVEVYISRSKIVAIAILMLISIPCLLLVAYLHLRVKELRSLHAMILSCMSTCLAIGYFLCSLVNIFEFDEENIGYAVQFFVLSYYFWFLFLCCNVAINIWIYIPLKIQKSQLTSSRYFGLFCIMSFMGPVILVIITFQKGLPGMPSYFMQGYTESIRESQRYFIPPVSAILLLSSIVLTAAFFRLQRLEVQDVVINSNDVPINNHSYEGSVFGEVKKDAKCTSLLGLILLFTWLLEVVTFYLPEPKIYLIIMDMANGLQGVFVWLIFLVVRRRRTVIFRWWSDRGSHLIEKEELNLI